MQRDDDQHKVWDPFKSADGLTAKQRAEMEKARAWEGWIAGKVGDPRGFDYETWLRNADHRAADEEEKKRQREGGRER